MDNAVDIMDKGFAESFDYTVWRREYFDRMNLEEVSSEAVDYVKKHPHQGCGSRI